MEDPVTTDNQTAAQSSPESNGGDISAIMGSMAGDTAPEAKPETSGEKAEGKAETAKDTKSDAPAWTSQLPEELRSNSDVMKQLTKFGKIGDLAKSYSELEAKIGKSLVKPGDDASEEESNAFYEKLGRPKDAKGYSIKDEDAQPFKDIAYKNGLTDAQATAMYESFKAIAMQNVKDVTTRMAQDAKDVQKALQEEYGTHYAEKLEMLKRGVKEYGGPALAQKLQATGLLYDGDVVKMFIHLGEQNAEAGSFNKGAAASGGYKSTAEGGMFTFKGL